MRRRDYRCTGCDAVFEFVDSMNDPIYEHLPCPECKAPAKRQVAIPTIGKIDRGTFVTDFPGARPGEKTTMTRDEVERRLAHKPEENTGPIISNLEDRVERLMAQQDAGTLKSAPELTPHQRETIEKALKPK